MNHRSPGRVSISPPDHTFPFLWILSILTVIAPSRGLSHHLFKLSLCTICSSRCISKEVEGPGIQVSDDVPLQSLYRCMIDIQPLASYQLHSSLLLVYICWLQRICKSSRWYCLTAAPTSISPLSYSHSTPFTYWYIAIYIIVWSLTSSRVPPSQLCKETFLLSSRENPYYMLVDVEVKATIVTTWIAKKRKERVEKCAHCRGWQARG